MAYVVLVGPEIEENLSLRYITATLTAAGHEVDIVPFNGESDFIPALQTILSCPEPPAVVGISLAFQWRARDFLALAVALREGAFKGHITLGGHFATFESRSILSDFPEVDSICRQEAEETMVKLTNAVAEGSPLASIPGLSLRLDDGEIVDTSHPPLPDLARLPRPDRRGEPAACFGHGIAPLVSSRGCYANCTFCCIAAWHEQSLPGKRYRLREVDDVADEMVALKKDRGIEVFVFHDDNFFVPGHKRNVERFTALADALDARKIGAFATVVKARPTDVDPDVFHILKYRLNCIRAYIGIETDADQGLRTLRRWAKSRQNHTSIEIIRSLDLYTCFNVLLFDPDTTLESIETNLDFMEYAAECPFNFGRVELYAGTPLLARMQAEGRCRGDYMQWDYDLGGPEVERVFELSMQAFGYRNFGNDALANRIMGTRFDIEVCRHFHPDIFDRAWHEEGKRLSRELGLDSVRGMRRIMSHVRTAEGGDEAMVEELTAELRATEEIIREKARALARELQARIGRGMPLTDLGDRVATPLQRARETNGFDAGALS
jgi:anaerobic magnesium-protoporphyrin IX monomethyl ester cyclase